MLMRRFWNHRELWALELHAKVFLEISCYYIAPILKLVEEMRDSETSVVVVVVYSNRTYPLFTFGI